MAKSLKQILNGVKASTKAKASLGTKPGVDYRPKAPAEQEFADKHEVEKHDDRAGNGPDVYAGAKTEYSMDTPQMKRFGHKKTADEKVYESREKESLQCNRTPKGTSCPVHGMAECATMKTLKEKPVKEDVEQIDEKLQTTPINPLVTLHDHRPAATNAHGIDGTKYPMVGHMHLSTAASIHNFDHGHALKALHHAGNKVGHEVATTGGVHVAYSKHNKTSMEFPTHNVQHHVAEETIDETLVQTYISGTKNKRAEVHKIGDPYGTPHFEVKKFDSALGGKLIDTHKTDMSFHAHDAAKKHINEEVELDEIMKFDRQHSPVPSMRQPSLKAHMDASDWHRGHYEQSTDSDEKKYHRDRMLHHTSQVQAMKSMGMKEDLDPYNPKDIGFDFKYGGHHKGRKAEVHRMPEGHYEVRKYKNPGAGLGTGEHVETVKHNDRVKAGIEAQKFATMKEGVERIDEFGGTYSKPARVPQRMIQPKAAERVANIADRKKMSRDDVQKILFNQGHGRKSERLIKSLRKEETEELDEKAIAKGKQTVLVTMKSDPHSKSGGATKRIKKSEYDPKIHNLAEDQEHVDERKMTDAEMDKREDIVKGMKKKLGDFRARYGKRAKDVMYATATKQAMKEDMAVPLVGSAQPPRGKSEEASEMVKTELRALANKAMHLVMQMPDNMHVEPWVQAKIAQAKEMVSSVHDYMIYGDHKEEDEQADTPVTFPSKNVDIGTVV
jgi:hypothetical protein